MGYASYMVYRDAGGWCPALSIYTAKMAVNWAFTPLFFGYRQTGLVRKLAALLSMFLALIFFFVLGRC